jgi:hypothetical protein
MARLYVTKAVLALAGLTLAAPAFAQTDQTIVVRRPAGNREYVVTKMSRCRGRVFITLKQSGQEFAVNEADVVSPALSAIPTDPRCEAQATPSPAPTPAPTPPPTPAPTAGPGTLVLKNGQRYTVTSMGRCRGRVYLRLRDGREFTVPEENVAQPPVETIPADPRCAEPPTPTPTPGPTPEPGPTPVAPPTPAPTPAAPGKPAGPPEFVPMRDRWDIAYPDSPRLVKGRTIDPYNQNVLKGDKPVIGNDVFLVLTGVIETPTEFRRLPVPSGVSAADPSSLEFFGRGNQLFTTPRAFGSLELFKGQTGFRPKTWALKVTAAGNVNYLRTQENNIVNIDPREGKTRRREDASLEEAFGELKLLDVSPYYDFVSVRAGIQPFVSDFRGFIFSDFNLGGRLFGNFANNKVQYNLAYFDLLEKETNSELNLFEKRDQKVFIGNLFKQDFLTLGYTFQLSYHRSQDEASEEQHYDANGFLVRPAKIGSARLHDVTSNYVGFAGDGHFGRLNVSHAAYYAFGDDTDNPQADRAQDIKAQMAALELSVDKDWLRFKVSGFFASGDDDSSDGEAKGFDTIYDATNFAGGPFSFWNRSGIPLTQTAVLLKTPGSLLPSLRSNKFEGQANFVNPGILLVHAGIDAELTPKLKAVLTGSYLRFHKTGALQLLLFQPNIRKPIGIDLGLGFLYRPLLNENIVISAGISGFLPGSGFDDIFTSPCSAASGCGADSKKLYNGFVLLKFTY